MEPGPKTQPPVIGAPSPLAGELPPPLPPQPPRKSGAVRQLLAALLSLCLGLFLADAFVSLLDDSLILLFGIHLLGTVRGFLVLLAMLIALATYVLMGITPLIPKRLFLPVILFYPLAMLALFPFTTYFYPRLQQFSWLLSLCQVVVGLSVLWWAQGGLKLRWPLMPQIRLGARGFSWLNLAGFLAANVFVALPAVAVYLGLCASLAVGHFSEGFLALRPSGFAVRVRKYVRADGKTVQLVPMAHIGEAEFYHKLSRSFPTNAVVLMEGVTDDKNLLTNNITYERMAKSLGLAEQQEEFNPVQVEMVMADVDVSQFTPNTIGFLNLVMLVHGKGFTVENVMKLLQYSPPPHFEEQLINDLVRKRNGRVLQELRDRLPQSDLIIVPWGAAHMPGISHGVQAAGFRLDETREYVVIRFRHAGAKSASAAVPPRPAQNHTKPPQGHPKAY
jgi:hypothetical protein